MHLKKYPQRSIRFYYQIKWSFIKGEEFMKTKTISVVALFALLVLAAVLVALPNKVTATQETPNVYNIDNPYVQPMIAGCTRYCSNCVKYGHNGACTAAGVCC
jgi:hypothetical protein